MLAPLLLLPMQVVRALVAVKAVVAVAPEAVAKDSAPVVALAVASVQRAVAVAPLLEACLQVAE